MQGGQIDCDLAAGVSLDEHTFLLRRATPDSPSASVEVDFSPVPPPPSAQQHTGRLASHPGFNQDRCYYTPAFVLEADRHKYITNAPIYFSLHQSKKEELQTEKTELMVPKPSKLSSFCCMCRLPFDDYLTHVNIPKHLEALRSSPYFNHIQDMCKLYNPVEVQDAPKKAPKKHGKKIQKQEKAKRVKKDLDMALHSTAIKLDSPLEVKSKETLV